MLPGPNYVYKCPSCGNLLSKRSLLSGNTFGAKFFSDGKRIAPKLPEFPNLTKCKKCNTILWLGKMEEVGTYEWGEQLNSEWQDADKADFLEIDDYFRAIDSGIVENKQDELFIRLRIWRAYNDRTRSGREIFEDTDDELRWYDNVKILLSLLDQSNIDDKIMTAEIHRNLGNFENCIEIIQSIESSDLEELKGKLIKQCAQKNRWVIQLN